jgi:ribosomal protein RSM22 (predicted rRNA methylase)
MSRLKIINTSGIDYEKAINEKGYVEVASYTNADGHEVRVIHEPRPNKGRYTLDLAGAAARAEMEDKRQSNLIRLRIKLAARKKAIQ